MWDVLVFALIGLLVGGAARVWYRRREPEQIVGTMVLGIIGALLAGMISWAVWSGVDGQLYPGALLTSMFGAVAAIVVWSCVAYVRGNRTPLAVRANDAPAGGPPRPADRV